ncbi:DNA polymerase III subunit delta [Lachnospiraceae bacterium 62-35]
MQTLNQDIKEKQFKRAYLLYGEEAFLKHSYKNRLKEAIIGDDTMNLNRFEGKGIDVAELISLADTLPFFAEHRLILVEDSGFFKSAAGEGLVSCLPSMPETTCFLFVESEVDKRNRLYKKLKSLGYAAELKRQTPAQLSSWAGMILSKEGKKITKNTMDILLSMTGDDMENIRMELEKLICYTSGRDVITEEDVEEICTIRAASRIFDMVGFIVNGKTRQAMDLYEDLLMLKEPPMRILFLIARQFNQILQIKELMEQGVDRSGIASRLKIPPFAVGKAMPSAKAFSKEQILSCVNLCVDLEEAVKTGRIQDRLAVELLITKDYRQKDKI